MNAVVNAVAAAEAKVEAEDVDNSVMNAAVPNDPMTPMMMMYVISRIHWRKKQSFSTFRMLNIINMSLTIFNLRI